MRKITVRNQFHNDCRCIWIPLLVIRRFYSRGQQPFLLLANNCISTNVATTRLTRSLLATRALYLQLRKVTEQLSELPLISLTFQFCYKLLYKEKITLIDHLILIMLSSTINASHQHNNCCRICHYSSRVPQVKHMVLL